MKLLSIDGGEPEVCGLIAVLFSWGKTRQDVINWQPLLGFRHSINAELRTDVADFGPRGKKRVGKRL